MLNKKSFKFEFIQYNLKYTVCFNANVTEEQAKDLYSSILQKMIECPCKCEDYSFEFYADAWEKYGVNYNDWDSKVEYIGEWFGDETLKNQDLIGKKIYPFEIERFQKNVGEYDYYFLVKTVDFFVEDEEGEEINDYHLLITKRERFNNKYKYKIVTQKLNLNPEEKDFYSHLYLHSFKCNIDNVEKLEMDFSVGEEGVKEDFETHEKNLLPVHIENFREVISYAPYIKILNDIDKLSTIEDMLKKINE